MLIAQRQQRIVDLVNEQKSVKVAELSKLFRVTEETIRRDLEKLEQQKKLTRSHGGAICLHRDEIEIPYSKREIMNVVEKRMIAEEAVKHVLEGDKIILDASTTAWYMAKTLPDIQITVLTNSIKVCLELNEKKEMTVISTGGVLLPHSLSFVGPLAESALDTYRVDKAFISCKGLHMERGLSESDEQQARIKKKMIECSASTFLMIDHSKFGIQAFSRITGLEKVGHIITDHKIHRDAVQVLAHQPLDLIKVI